MLIYWKKSIFLYSAYSVAIKVIHNYKAHTYVLVKSTFQCNHSSEMRSFNKAEIKCDNIFFSITLYWPYNFMKCFGFDEVVGLGLEKCSLGKCWTWEAFYAFHFSIYTKSTELDKLIHSINFWCLRYSALHAIIWLKVAHPWVLTLCFICVKGFSLTCEILASKHHSQVYHKPVDGRTDSGLRFPVHHKDS